MNPNPEHENPQSEPPPEPEVHNPLPTKAEVEARWARLERERVGPVKLGDATASFMDLVEKRNASRRSEAPPPSALPSALPAPNSNPSMSGAALTRSSMAVVPRAVPSLTRTEAADLLPASVQDCEEALMVVHGILGIVPANGTAEATNAFHERVHEAAVVLATAEPSWSVRALRESVRALARDPRLDDKLRFGRPITPADFERQRAGEERVHRDEETGEERVITTLRGFALKVAKSKLYTHAEAFGLWNAAGQPGTFSDARRADGTLAIYPDSMFTVVSVDGEIRWRLK